MPTDLERFLDCMEYRASDRRPNHELGAWAQTRTRWLEEAPNEAGQLTWSWFDQDPYLGLDRREYVPVNYGFIPPFAYEVLEETDEWVIQRNEKGIVSKALKTGAEGRARMCMDQYLEFPVTNAADFAEVKKRLAAGLPQRYPADLEERAAAWQQRQWPLVLGRNCAANGFYWRAREFMGTEALSFAWYDQPALMHDMMAFYADFIIDTSRPVLETIDVEYFCLNEDLSMKGGPLLSPDTYRTFILPHLTRLIEFMKSHGVRYVALDTDGDPTVLIPLFMDAGVDIIWPIERASNISPQQWRRQFGKTLRLWGGVDKRVLARGRDAIRAHLAEFLPLIEEGGFIPTVDHTVPPDVSWDNFKIYMDLKAELLAGNAAALE